MTNEQILEDAIIADIAYLSEGMLLSPVSENTDITENLTKFAELTKARHEMQSLKTIADIREILGVGHAPMMTELPAFIKQGLARANQWIDCSVELPVINETGNWHRSKRCVVIVDRGYEKYEAFANLVKYLGIDAEWSIDGHNGDWHKNVTHWLPLPPNAQQPMKASGE